MQLREHSLFLSWVGLLTAMMVSLYIVWDQGLVALWLESDRSRISFVMAALFVVATAAAGWRTWLLSQAHAQILNMRDPNPESLQDSHGLLGEISWRLLPGSVSEGESAIAALERHLKGAHDWGWFVADAMFKLGLLGTVVGFILMLGSIGEVEDLDIAAIQKVLVNMTEGMRVALYTTLSGLVGGTLLGLQAQMLDRGAENFMAALARALHRSYNKQEP